MSISVATENRAVTPLFRFVVKVDGQYYVSSYTVASSSSTSQVQHTLNDPASATWAAYHPSTNLNFDQAGATFAAIGFGALEAVGYYYEMDATTSNINFRNAGFLVDASVSTGPQIPTGYVDDQESLQPTMDLWMQTHFDDPGDESVAGPLADPNSDGTVNLLKFALRGDPSVDDGETIMPGIGIDEERGGPVFLIRVIGPGVFDGEGGYVVENITYGVVTASQPTASAWQTMMLSEANSQLVDGEDGPVLRVQLEEVAAGESSFARLWIRSRLDGE